MANRKQRLYEPLWRTLRDTGSVEYVADPRAHGRIEKALIKEKYNDLGFKLILANRNQTARIKKVKPSNQTWGAVKFILVYSVSVYDL